MSTEILENEVIETEVEEVVEEVVEQEVVENEGNSDESDLNNFEENTEDKDEEEEEICPDCGKPISKCTCKNHAASEEEEDEEEICPECGKPVSKCVCGKYAALQEEFEALQSNYSALEAEVVGLREFKASVEKKEKEAMINSFYMLSEEDKADVINNIDNYSLEDIESKLSVICVRNKVSFANENTEEGISYNLNDSQEEGLLPAWVEAAKAVRDNK